MLVTVSHAVASSSNLLTTCESQIELPYYAFHDDPLCFHCGSEISLQICPGCFPIRLLRDKRKPSKRKIRGAFAKRTALAE